MAEGQRTLGRFETRTTRTTQVQYLQYIAQTQYQQSSQRLLTQQNCTATSTAVVREPVIAIQFRSSSAPPSSPPPPSRILPPPPPPPLPPPRARREDPPRRNVPGRGVGGLAGTRGGASLALS